MISSCQRLLGVFPVCLGSTAHLVEDDGAEERRPLRSSRSAEADSDHDGVEDDTSLKDLNVKVSLRGSHVHADLGKRAMRVTESLGVLAIAVGKSNQQVQRERRAVKTVNLR